ncbi:hypothetical protein GF376_00635, partial [Candidatus Peregrinibacteria bacterium]|nr:hypothetical protein [Candidatus Peregrinibacteria bacterium]
MCKKIYYENRKSVPKKDQWKLNAMYKSTKEWEKDYQTVTEEIPKLRSFKGKLKTPQKLLACFKELSSTFRKLEKLYVYSSHKYSEDVSNSHSLSLMKKAEHLYNNFIQAISFIDPELIKLPSAELKKIAKLPEFKDYDLDLKRLILRKKHILSDQEEALLSKVSMLSSDPENIFSALDNADLDLGEIKDEKGKTIR